MDKKTRSLLSSVLGALTGYHDWCHNNVAYFPDTPEAKRIAKRAEKLMVQVANELLAQEIAEDRAIRKAK